MDCIIKPSERLAAGRGSRGRRPARREEPPAYDRKSFFSTREAAAFLNISPRTLDGYRRDGKGPAYCKSCAGRSQGPVDGAGGGCRGGACLGGGDEPAQPRTLRLGRGGPQEARRHREEDGDDDLRHRVPWLREGHDRPAARKWKPGRMNSRSALRRFPPRSRTSTRTSRASIAARWRVSRKPCANRKNVMWPRLPSGGLIERIVLMPGPNRGDLQITLRGDLGTILEWTGNGPKRKRPTHPHRKCRSDPSQSSDLLEDYWIAATRATFTAS